MEHIYDMVILGGGPAGYTAALYAARAGLDCLVVEKISAGGQMTLTDVIDNYSGFEEGVDGFTLGMKMQAHAEKFGAKTMYAEVLSVDFTEKIKKTETSDGTLLSKTAVISTGASPRELGLEEEEKLTGFGVHYCAHCDGRFYKDKTVAVVGGGNSAASDALYLSRIAKKVYLIHRRDTLRATKIYHEPLLKSQNIEFLWNSTVDKLLSDNRLSGICVKNVKEGTLTEIGCDALFVSIGRKPATEFLGNALPLDEKGYIIADETTKTAISGVYAIGDVRTKTVRQVITAAADGAICATLAEEYLSLNENK